MHSNWIDHLKKSLLNFLLAFWSFFYKAHIPSEISFAETTCKHCYLSIFTNNNISLPYNLHTNYSMICLTLGLVINHIYSIDEGWNIRYCNVQLLWGHLHWMQSFFWCWILTLPINWATSPRPRWVFWYPNSYFDFFMFLFPFNGLTMFRSSSHFLNIFYLSSFWIYVVYLKMETILFC